MTICDSVSLCGFTQPSGDEYSPSYLYDRALAEAADKQLRRLDPSYRAMREAEELMDAFMRTTPYGGKNE